MTCRNWLPGLVQISPWTAGTYDELYEVFKDDWIRHRPKYKGNEVWFFPEKEDGRPKIFWHLTDRDDSTTEDRLPDMRRCERLRWARAVVENAECDDILDWDYEEGDGSICTYLWLEQEDYVVILKKYPDGRRRLKSAHYLDVGHKKRGLKKKYGRRVDAQK